MKRDMELVREILLAIEARSDFKPRKIELDGRDDTVVQRHVKLLLDAGLIIGRDQRHLGSQGPEVHVKDLTWEGHDFLAAIRDDGVWGKMKSAITERELAGMPLSVIKDVCIGLTKEWAREKLGIGGD